MKKYRFLTWLIIVLTAVSLYVNFPSKIPLKFDLSFNKTQLSWLKMDKEISRPALSWSIGNHRFYRDLEIKKGVDLAGGTHLVFQAEMAGVDENDRSSAIQAARDNIEKRVNLFGVSEPVIQTSKVNDDYYPNIQG